MYKCPGCDSEISLDDVNVSADIALCRACGQTNSFAELTECAKQVDLDELKIPKHIRIEPDFGDGKSLICKKMSPAALFLIPFTAVWSGMSMWGIYGTQFIKGEFNLTMSLFGLPFLIGSIVLVSVCSFMLFGKRVVTMSSGQGVVFTGVGPLGWKRRFLYTKSLKVSVDYSAMRQNNRPVKCVVIQGGSKELKLGWGMKEDLLEYIAAFIRNEAKK
jgi:hypothetical protein